jgi:DNA polymerase-1
MQILTAAQFNDAVRVWSKEVAPFLDFETNAKEHWDPAFRIVCCSITGYNREAQMIETIQIPIAHNEGQNCGPEMLHSLAEFCSTWNIGSFWVQSEAMTILAKLDTRARFVDDPYIALRLLQDSQTANLKEAVAKYEGVTLTRIEEIIPNCVPADPSSYDFSKVHAQSVKGIEYSENDSFHGFKLARTLEQKIIASKMFGVYRLEVAAAAILAEQSFIGYEIDLKVMAKELANEDKRLLDLQSSVYYRLNSAAFPLNSTAKLSAALAKLGIYSPVQTKRTAKGGGGNDSWAKPVMEAMIREGLPPEQDALFKEIVEWKSSFSVRNTLRKSPTRVSVDGRIHPIWKSIGYDGTARAYAENPSITSLPMGCRRAMRAPKGKRWMKFDWKQAELRALAAASQDQKLIELLNSGQDPHAAIYAKMKGIEVGEVTEEQRESSKVISYSILYSGGSAYHVARQLAVDMPTAVGLVQDYLGLFSTLRDFLENIRERAKKTYRVRTFMNRVRRLEGGDDEKVMNQACDAMGQQSIGTALKIALKKMCDYAEVKHPVMKGLCQIIPVFDAIFYCIDADVPVDRHVDTMKDLVQINMAGVILEAEFETGLTWGDMQEIIPGLGQTQAELSEGAQAIERYVGRPTSMSGEDADDASSESIETAPLSLADAIRRM